MRYSAHALPRSSVEIGSSGAASSSNSYPRPAIDGEMFISFSMRLFGSRFRDRDIDFGYGGRL